VGRLSISPWGWLPTAPHCLSSRPSLSFHSHKYNITLSSWKNDPCKLSYLELCEPQLVRAVARLAVCLLPSASRLESQVTMNFLNGTLFSCPSHFSSLSIRGTVVFRRTVKCCWEETWLEVRQNRIWILAPLLNQITRSKCQTVCASVSWFVK
jgi:hypothetical protein